MENISEFPLIIRAPRRTVAGLLFLPVLAAALLPAPARADGGFFKAQRDRIPVPIPAQRPLLVHRDGVERLVVESTVDAKAQALGWILPLPAKPTSVEAATPGMLDTLDRIQDGRLANKLTNYRRGGEVVHSFDLTGPARAGEPRARELVERERNRSLSPQEAQYKQREIERLTPILQKLGVIPARDPQRSPDLAHGKDRAPSPPPVATRIASDRFCGPPHGRALVC